MDFDALHMKSIHFNSLIKEIKKETTLTVPPTAKTRNAYENVQNSKITFLL